MLLGITRCLGHPFVPGMASPNARALVRDMVPIAGGEASTGDLLVHSDFPRNVTGDQYPEPEHLLLYAVRGDPTHEVPLHRPSLPRTGLSA